MTTTMVKPAGTFDHARPVDQMRAIDLALQNYFRWAMMDTGTTNWLRTRQAQRKR